MKPIRHLRGAIFALLLLIAATVRSDTILTDAFGNIMGRLPWPTDRDVWMPLPTVSGPPPNFYHATPVPTPIKTPAPVQQPKATPKPA